MKRRHEELTTADEAPPPSQDDGADLSIDDVAQDFEDAHVFDHPPVLPGDGGLGAGIDDGLEILAIDRVELAGLRFVDQVE